MEDANFLKLNASKGYSFTLLTELLGWALLLFWYFFCQTVLKNYPNIFSKSFTLPFFLSTFNWQSLIGILIIGLLSFYPAVKLYNLIYPVIRKFRQGIGENLPKLKTEVSPLKPRSWFIYYLLLRVMNLLIVYTLLFFTTWVFLSSATDIFQFNQQFQLIVLPPLVAFFVFGLFASVMVGGYLNFIESKEMVKAPPQNP